MSRWLTILLGTGRGRFWHLLLWLLLWPLVPFTRYFIDLVPGAGPQGGEAVLLLIVFYWMLWTIIAVIHALRMGRRRAGTWWQRLLVVLAPTAAMVLSANWSGAPIMAAVIVAALLIGPQLWALHMVRRG